MRGRTDGFLQAWSQPDTQETQTKGHKRLTHCHAREKVHRGNEPEPPSAKEALWTRD